MIPGLASAAGGGVADGAEYIQGVVGGVWPGVEGERRAGGGRVYTVDGAYQVTPFVEPMRGCAAILAYWTHVAETERDIAFGYECWR